MTILVPEVKGKNLMKLLAFLYSEDGRVELGGPDDMKEFIKLKEMFGISTGKGLNVKDELVNKELVKQPEKQRSQQRGKKRPGDGNNKKNGEAKKIKVEDENLNILDPETVLITKKSSQRALQEPVEVDMEEITPNSGMKAKTKLHCGICGKLKKTPSELLIHLSLNHFYKKFVEMFESNQRKCPFCSTEFNGNNRRERFAKHVGSVHKKVLDYVSKSMKETVLEAGKPEIWRRKNVLKGPSCRLCGLGQENLTSLLKHLSSTHYSGQLRQLFEANKGQCPTCQKSFGAPPGSHKTRQQFAIHVGSTHLQVLEFLPKKLKTPLQPLLAKRQARTLGESVENVPGLDSTRIALL